LLTSGQTHLSPLNTAHNAHPIEALDQNGLKRQPLDMELARLDRGDERLFPLAIAPLIDLSKIREEDVIKRRAIPRANRIHEVVAEPNEFGNAV
jgi:hypothetical protein